MNYYLGAVKVTPQPVAKTYTAADMKLIAAGVPISQVGVITGSNILPTKVTREEVVTSSNILGIPKKYIYIGAGVLGLVLLVSLIRR